MGWKGDADGWMFWSLWIYLRRIQVGYFQQQFLDTWIAWIRKFMYITVLLSLVPLICSEFWTICSLPFRCWWSCFPRRRSVLGIFEDVPRCSKIQSGSIRHIWLLWPSTRLHIALKHPAILSGSRKLVEWMAHLNHHLKRVVFSQTAKQLSPLILRGGISIHELSWTTDTR